LIQVEFYFSDANLATDKFLLEKVGGSANNAVPISVLHSFKRMRHFQPFLAVVAALKESTVLDVLDDESVKRKVPLDDTFNEKSIEEVQKVYETAAMARSVYVKGFGEETPSTQFDIEAFFTPYGPTNAIRLRRTVHKLFKGSVFVEFDSEKTQEAFLSLDPKPKWKGTDLTIKSKKQYCDEKVDDIQAGKIRRNSPASRGKDDRDWRARRDEDKKGGFRGDRNKGGNRGFGRGRGRGRGGRDNNNRDRERKPRDEQ
jgi:lupus La protein